MHSIRETNCVNTTSGSCHYVSVVVSSAGRKFHFRPAYDTDKSDEQLVHVLGSEDVAGRLMLIAEQGKWQYVVKTCR